MHQIARRVPPPMQASRDRRGAMATATGATANVKAACVHHPFHVVAIMHQIAVGVRMMHPKLTWDRRGAMATATGTTTNVKAAMMMIINTTN